MGLPMRSHASEVRALRGQSCWIQFDETDVPAISPLYAGEGNTTHAGIDVTVVTSVGPLGVTKAWDEPLDAPGFLKSAVSSSSADAPASPVRTRWSCWLLLVGIAGTRAAAACTEAFPARGREGPPRAGMRVFPARRGTGLPDGTDAAL